MTENLLQQLEERTMVLLAEVETLRNRVISLTRENADLKNDQIMHMKKVKELLSLLDSLDLGSGLQVNKIEDRLTDPQTNVIV